MSYKIVVSSGKENFDDAFFIRTEVFIKEQGFVDEFDEIDNVAIQVVIYDNDAPIATARAFLDESGHYHAGRIAVMKDYRKKGIGRILMDAIENEVKKCGGREVVISAQRRAVGFYEKVGYISFGEEYLDEGYPHINMKKDLI